MYFYSVVTDEGDMVWWKRTNYNQQMKISDQVADITERSDLRKEGGD